MTGDELGECADPRDGRSLYVIDADGGRIYGWSVGSGGTLEPTQLPVGRGPLQRATFGALPRGQLSLEAGRRALIPSSVVCLTPTTVTRSCSSGTGVVVLTDSGTRQLLGSLVHTTAGPSSFAIRRNVQQRATPED
jgi:hypothetical protein